MNPSSRLRGKRRWSDRHSTNHQVPPSWGNDEGTRTENHWPGVPPLRMSQCPGDNRVSMHITIEAANNAASLRAVHDVREEVFGKQCYRRLPRLEDYDPTQILTLVARSGDTNEPMAALSVVETTDDAALHSALDLLFPDGIRVARYTQLAVLRAYRGLHLPAHLLSEARRRFVVPNQILYTWLLFNAETARSSSFCRELRFKCSEKEFATEYGRSRVLVRKERHDATDSVNPHILESATSRWNRAPEGIHGRYPHLFPQAMLDNEWLAQ